MWQDKIRKVIPYVPGEQPVVKDLIKLNTNENPYPPSPRVYEALENFDYTNLRKYPDYNSTELVDQLMDYYGVKRDNIFVGVGSDDVLQTAFLAYFYSDKPILFPDITYSFYEVWANLYRIPYEKKPLTEDFKIDKNDYLTENGGIIIANPNAPTGLAGDIDMLREIVEKNKDSVVIIDEAYIDFGGQTMLPYILDYDNLLIVRTLSKSRSMAGIRIGYAFGSKALIKQLQDVKFSINSYTMNMPTIALGAAALSDHEYFDENIRKVVETREWTKKELARLGFEFQDSKTNFIFAKHKTADRDYIFTELRARKILVRAFDGERIKDYIRISIGTDEEMHAVIDALEEILAQGGRYQ